MAPKKSKIIEEEQFRDEGIKTIHEMISEALLGTTSISTGSPTHFNTSGLTDQEIQLLYTLNGNEGESQLTLGELYSKYQNLDFRLSRVERVIAQRDDVDTKRVAQMPRSDYTCSNDFFFNSSNITSPSHNMATIDPILTSTTDILKNNFQGDSSASAYSPSPSVSNRHNMFQKKDEIKRSELDHYCLPLLENNPKPTTEQLQEIVYSIGPAYPEVTGKKLLSKVREWFRKRREYMSQRIFLVCAEVFQDVQIETESGLDAQMEYLTQNDTLIDLVLEKADLDIIDQVVAKEYCREKIFAYFCGLFKPSSLKNRTQQ